MSKLSALEKARKIRRESGLGIGGLSGFLFLIIVVGLLDDYFNGGFSRTVPFDQTAIGKQALPVLVLLIAAIAGVMAITQTRLMVFQMEQVDEGHQYQAELIKSTSDLAKELRRRPDVSNTVNFSLFGPNRE